MKAHHAHASAPRDNHLSIGAMVGRLRELAATALPVARTAFCEGCGQAFEPIRVSQRHRRPSCRQLSAVRSRRSRPPLLFE